ncbi:MAG: hypothetical protein ACLFRD_12200 [Nitriliruptoraceae bacterium]
MQNNPDVLEAYLGV